MRLLCPHCRPQKKVDADFLHRDPRYRALAVEGAGMGAGELRACGGTGYSGRRAVFEMFESMMNCGT